MQGRRRVLSPAKEHLATCAEASSFLGIRRVRKGCGRPYRHWGNAGREAAFSSQADCVGQRAAIVAIRLPALTGCRRGETVCARYSARAVPLTGGTSTLIGPRG